MHPDRVSENVSGALLALPHVYLRPERPSWRGAQPSTLLGLLWQGCSGSSITARLLRQVLVAHGLTVLDFDCEGLKAKKNPWYMGSLHPSWPQALLQMERQLALAGAVYVLKATPNNFDDPVMAQTLQSLVSPFVSGGRWNALDVITCEVRDCFHGPPSTSDAAFPVDEHGNLSRLCFIRRRANSSAARPRAYKAYFRSMRNMLSRIDDVERRKQNQAVLLQSLNLTSPPILNVTHEQMTEFQHSDAKLERSVAMYSRILAAWRVIPSKAAVRRALAPYVGTQPPPPRHTETIHNAHEVQAALNRAGKGHYFRP